MSEKPCRILIIDDSPEDRQSYRRSIAADGAEDYVFWETGSGEEGLRLCRELTPDCILLDFNLPDLDGLEFLERVEACGGGTKIPIIMLTGHGNEAVAVQAMKRGALDYIVKQLNSANIRHAIHSAIDKGSMRRKIDDQSRELENLATDRAQLIAELQKQTAALSEANQRKDEFLAMLAHELRNPLAPIRNSLQVIRMARDQPAVFEQARDMIERHVGIMVRLVDDLLDIARVSRGQIGLRKERIDLVAIIKAAIETSRPLLESLHHQLVLSLPEEPLYLEADATRLGQVIANLLNNAAKYTEPKGRVWLTAERHGNEAVVRIRDTGIGMDAEMLPKVFDLFTQADRTLERSQGGLGIGLTLVKNLVHLHGGTIEAASPGRGHGSEFTLRLPAHPVNKAVPEKKPQASGNMLFPDTVRPRRILVVDDNRDAADSLAMLLRMLGHSVHAVHSGFNALQAVQTETFEVVFLDLGMPGMSGLEVACRLRANPVHKALRLVALTGWGADSDRQRTKEAGFDYHFVKPVAPEDLERYLSQI